MPSPSSEEPPAYDLGAKDSPPKYEHTSSAAPFPAQFSVYQKTGISRPSTAMLAADESTPLHHISLGVGLMDPGLPDVDLHADPNERSSIIANSKLALSGCAHHIQLEGFSISKEMVLATRNLTRKYIFKVDSEGSEKKGKTAQVFEWRPSRGEEVRGLGLRGHGWKLVRLGSSDNSGSQTSDSPHDPEVVAVWSRYGDAKSKKLLGFSFLGSGVSAAFGREWQTMAVITALAIWHSEIMD